MISPYADLLRTLGGTLVRLGFELLEDDSYLMVFQKGDFRLEFAADRYQHLSLTSTLSHASDDPVTGPMQVADIMSELAPDRLDRIRGMNLLTIPGLGRALREEVEFLRDFEAEVFVRPAGYRTRYEKENRPSWAPDQS